MKGINKKLDDFWSKAVKERAGYRCEYCGDTRTLNSHHAIGKRNFAVRYNISNGVCLCAKHHTFSSEFSAHQTPMAFTDWIKLNRGEDWYDDLNALANSTKKWTTAEKKQLLSELQQSIKEEL